MALLLTRVGGRYTYRRCGRRGHDDKEWGNVGRRKIEVLRPSSSYDGAETLPKTPLGVQRMVRRDLPTARVCLLLHHGGRDGQRRTRDSHTSTWVDNRDCVTGAQCGWLVDFHLLVVV